MPSITFDFLSRGADQLAGNFTKTGDSAVLAARGTKVLQDTIERLGARENRTAEESARLAAALRLTGDAADRAAAKMVIADAAVRRLDDALKKASRNDGGGLLGRVGNLVPGLAGTAGGASGLGALAPAGGLLTNPYSIAAITAGIAALLPELAGLASGFAAAGAGAGAFYLLAHPAISNLQGDIQKLNSANQALGIAQQKYLIDPTKANATTLQNAQVKYKAIYAQMGQDAGPAAAGVLKLHDAYVSLTNAFQPQVFKIFNDGLRIANQLLPAVLPFANAFANALDGLLKKLAGFTASKGFQDWLAQFQKLTGPSVTAIGEGLGKVAIQFGKLLTVMSAKDVVNAINIAFTVLSGTIDGLRHVIEAIMRAWDVAVPVLVRDFEDFRHRAAVVFDGARHDIAHTWDQIFENSIGIMIRLGHNIETQFNSYRHGIAVAFDGTRRDIAAAWDTVWNNTIGRVRRGIADTVAFFTGLPGKITGALGVAGTVLLNWGKGVIQGLLQGMTSVITQVWDFIKSIPSKILHFLGLRSPPQWAIDAGKHIMNGIGIGMQQAQAALKKATDAAAAAAASAAGKVGGGGGPATGDAAAAQGYARSRLGAYGWAGSQMGPLISLWNQESGWNRFAYNASSGATGIPQALPYSKMPRAAWLPSQGGQANMGAQIDWGLGYIKGRYGSPAGAWAHEQAFNWYDRGGWLPRGLSLALNTTGRPEQVIAGDGLDGLVAELRALRAEVRQLTGVASEIPRRTGQHVAAGVNGAAAAASFRVRYP